MKKKIINLLVTKGTKKVVWVTRNRKKFQIFVFIYLVVVLMCCYRNSQLVFLATLKLDSNIWFEKKQQQKKLRNVNKFFANNSRKRKGK